MNYAVENMKRLAKFVQQTHGIYKKRSQRTGQISEIAPTANVNLASKNIQKLLKHNWTPHTKKVRDKALEHI